MAPRTPFVLYNTVLEMLADCVLGTDKILLFPSPSLDLLMSHLEYYLESPLFQVPSQYPTWKQSPL